MSVNGTETVSVSNLKAVVGSLSAKIADGGGLS